MSLTRFTALRRFTPLRAKPKPKAERVSPEVHAEVMRRDGACMAWRLGGNHGFGHACRNRWGTPHLPTDVSQLTLEHVKDDLRMGVRAPSDPAHLVAVCAFVNLMPPTKAMREAFRAYLRTLPAEAQR